MWKLLLGFLLATSPEAEMQNVVIVSHAEAYGTAFSIGDGRFLTAKHLVEGVEEVQVLDIKENTYVGKVTYLGTLDFAVIEVKGFKGRLGVRKSRPKMGERIHYIGHPNSMFFSYFEGYVSRPKVTLFGEDRIMAILHSGGGASGSAILNEEGKVVGILTESLGNYTFIVPMEVVCKEIKC